MILEARNIYKSVQMSGETLGILHDINFSIPTGSTNAIIGSSGSGKSTLLGILAGLDTTTSGAVVLHGNNLSKLTEDERSYVRAQHVGFVFQSFQLVQQLTSLENVALALELKGIQDNSYAKELLDTIGLAARMHHYPKQLSGGEQQRVAIARAFAASPSILFADEPTGNLDTITGNKISDLLFEMNALSNTTLILVTHDHILAARCSRQITLGAGRITNDTSEVIVNA